MNYETISKESLLPMEKTITRAIQIKCIDYYGLFLILRWNNLKTVKLNWFHVSSIALVFEMVPCFLNGPKVTKRFQVCGVVPGL